MYITVNISLQKYAKLDMTKMLRRGHESTGKQSGKTGNVQQKYWEITESLLEK